MEPGNNSMSGRPLQALPDTRESLYTSRWTALPLYGRLPVGDTAAWFLFSWVLVYGAAHFVYLFASGSGATYVPGRLTASLPITAVAKLGGR